MISQTGYEYISIPGILLGSYSILLWEKVAGQRGSHALEAVGWICMQICCPRNAVDIWTHCDSATFRTFWLQLVFSLKFLI